MYVRDIHLLDGVCVCVCELVVLAQVRWFNIDLFLVFSVSLLGWLLVLLAG